jgi:hypothetical protein
MSCDCSCNDVRQLLTQVLDFRFQFRDVQSVTANLRVGGSEFADQDTNLLACVREGSLADAGRDIPLFLTEFDGLRTAVCVLLQRLKLRTGGVVVVLGDLLRQQQRLFPLRDGSVGELRGNASQGNRITDIECGLVPPEAAHGLGDCGGRSAL